MSENREETIFEKIIKKEIPADIIYEDDTCLAFKDLNPIAPTHILLIPKEHIAKIGDATRDHAKMLGELMTKISVITNQLGINDNFRVVINNGAESGQTVFHLHLHIISGRAMQWPPG
jgi:histidine triad (HIT) family protein